MMKVKVNQVQQKEPAQHKNAFATCPIGHGGRSRAPHRPRGEEQSAPSIKGGEALFRVGDLAERCFSADLVVLILGGRGKGPRRFVGVVSGIA